MRRMASAAAREEMGCGPNHWLLFRLADQAQPGFMHERGGLQESGWALRCAMRAAANLRNSS